MKLKKFRMVQWLVHKQFEYTRIAAEAAEVTYKTSADQAQR